MALDGTRGRERVSEHIGWQRPLQCQYMRSENADICFVFQQIILTAEGVL